MKKPKSDLSKKSIAELNRRRDVRRLMFYLYGPQFFKVSTPKQAVLPLV